MPRQYIFKTTKLKALVAITICHDAFSGGAGDSAKKMKTSKTIMMNKGYLLFFLLLLIGPVEGYAQMKKAPPKPEVMPSFPGGVEEMYKYIYTNVKYPADARKNGIRGTVAVEFMVDEKGVLSDFLVTSGIGGGCDEEAVRVITSMNTAHRWTPATTNGQPVKALFTLPIKFVLK